MRSSPEKDGELEPASIPFNGPTGENLEVRGRFKASLSRKGEESWQTIYVVRNLSRPLLGRPEIQALKVAVLIEPVQRDSIVEEFPELFKGLGKLKDSYKIKLYTRRRRSDTFHHLNPTTCATLPSSKRRTPTYGENGCYN